jgi:hypothetical protein
MGKHLKRYTADFETTTDENDCRVWAWSICEIGSPENFYYGNDISTIFDFFQNHGNAKYYYHNLKFDSSFLVNYMFSSGFKCMEDKENPCENSFCCLISSMGQWFSIDIWLKRDSKGRLRHVQILDSLKILNFSVAQIAKDFDLPISKLELDYKTFREVGHVLTAHEISYIRNDVEIMARALHIMFEQGFTKMTIASDALEEYKKLNGSFRKYFPELPLDVDSFIRDSYKGGFTYLSPKYVDVKLGAGMTLDINSMYPSMMYNKPMPISEPKIFSGKYEYDPDYPLYVISFWCSFDLKKGKIPSIQLKNNRLFQSNQYIESSNEEVVRLCLTSVDYELFREQYNVQNLEFEGGYKFKQATGLFKTYIDKFMKMKIESKKAGNKAQTLIAKLFLNSLYGRFGLNPNTGKKIPVYDGQHVGYKIQLAKEGERKPVYIPVATFITSYARRYIIESAQTIRDWSIKNKGFDAYYYSDTDSLKVGLTKDDLEALSDVLDIDDYRLGAWAWEESWVAWKGLRQKCYIEEFEDGSISATIAGLPKRLAPLINFDNFRIGFTTAELDPEQVKEHGGYKLRYKHVKGGVILQDTDFTIK